MGIAILAITLIVEAAFTGYRIITKSSQERLRSFIRIGALAAFVLFTVTSVIQWSARWYGLAVLLLVWAGLGVWSLFWTKTDSKGYAAGRVVAKAFAALLLVFIVITPALIFPQHQAPRVTGQYQVATVIYTYADKSRVETFTNTGENRKVNVEFWYPKTDGGKYPLVVFDHGTGGVKTSNTSTFVELASNGYVVCSLDHPYHSLFTVDTDGHATRIDPSYLQEYMNLNNGSMYSEEEKFKLQQQWMGLRIADIDFTLDTILEQVNDPGADAVYQLIDARKIGLMGHSLGGESVAQVARERNDVSAVVNLDADLGGEYLDYVDGKYVMNDEVYPVPILTIFSDDLVRLIDAIPDADTTIAVKHVTATAPDAYEIHLEGTNHMSLTDLPLVSPFLASLISGSVKNVGGETAAPLLVIEKMNAIVLEFFNVYLKDQGSFTAAENHQEPAN
jgi:dienelactone hydrolase